MDLSSLRAIGLDISFGQFLWSLLIIFFMLVFFVILFHVLVDLFRDHELSGWSKAGWLIFIVVLPFLGLLVYMIVRGPGMARREATARAAARQEIDAYVRSVASSGSPVDEIARAKELLDSGAITQEEFEALKRTRLSS
jgi:hypothetical protein